MLATAVGHDENTKKNLKEIKVLISLSINKKPPHKDLIYPLCLLLLYIEFDIKSNVFSENFKSFFLIIKLFYFTLKFVPKICTFQTICTFRKTMQFSA